MDNRCNLGGSGNVDNGSCVVGSSMENGNSMIGSWGISSVVGNSSRCVNSSSKLLSVVVSINSLGSSVGLANDGSDSAKVGLEDRGGDRGGVSNLDGLVVGLVSSRHSEQGSTDKGLNIL